MFYQPGVDCLQPKAILMKDAAQTLLAQALAQACCQAYEPAISLLRELLYQYPDNEWAEDAQVLLGLSYFYSGAYDQAWLTFQALIETHPYSAYAQAVSHIIYDFDRVTAVNIMS
jgi:outer membrane protein assembly factor BamD (BamD/ComL family)